MSATKVVSTTEGIPYRDYRHWAWVVGQNVRRLRCARGMSQRVLSSRMHRIGFPIHQSRLSCMERCVKTSAGSYVMVTIDLAMALAAAIGVDLSRLLEDPDPSRGQRLPRRVSWSNQSGSEDDGMDEITVRVNDRYDVGDRVLFKRDGGRFRPGVVRTVHMSTMGTIYQVGHRYQLPTQRQQDGTRPQPIAVQCEASQMLLVTDRGLDLDKFLALTAPEVRQRYGDRD